MRWPCRCSPFLTNASGTCRALRCRFATSNRWSKPSTLADSSSILATDSQSPDCSTSHDDH
jgi:hypothetical protein